MSKRTDTPDTTTSGQALEQGSARAAKIPSGPTRIYTALNENFFLGYRSPADYYIKTVSKGSAFFQQWEFLHFSDGYHIKCYTSDYYMDGDMKLLPYVGARPYGNGTWQKWYAWEAGPGGYLYFTNAANNKILSVSANNVAEGIGVTLFSRNSSTPEENQKFRIYT